MKKSGILLAALLLSGSVAEARQYAPQFGAAVGVSETQVFIADGRNRISPGEVHVYAVAADGTWREAQTLSAPGASDTADGFGQAVSIAGDRLVVGSPVAGAAHVFTRSSSGEWRHAARIAADPPGFGSSVAIDGDRMLIGATGDMESAGTVHFFRRAADGSWQGAGTLDVDGAQPNDGYGATLALKGGVAAIGSPGTASRSGAVHLFRFDADASAWQPATTIENPMEGTGHRFGNAIHLGQAYVAIGAPGAQGGVGSVYIYRHDSDSQDWEFDTRLAPFSAGGSEQFGTSLAFDGRGILVGAPGRGEREGAVYRFEIEGSRITATSRLPVNGLQYRSSFGGAVAAGERVAVVGAVGQDNYEGAGFVYTGSSGSWIQGSSITNEFGRFASVTGEMVECEDEQAESFTCRDVDLMSFLSTTDVGAARGIQVNDVWGWEDPETGHEYALVGRTDGTSFVDLTDPHHPVFVGDLPHTDTAVPSLWRDVKVYKDHAFIVADGAGAHHMQVFDLRQLRNVTNPPMTFEETAIYRGIFSSHNIVINEDTGYAFAVGSDSGGETCGGALHMINIQDPVNPSFAGCFADTRTGRGRGSTHDAQCVTYHGPDSDYTGREICLSSNGNALSIADVTDKADPRAISIAEYPNVAYTHQGWLTEDHRYFYLNDEGDEASGLVDATRTLIFDLNDLEEPELVGEYFADNNAIDHNLYVRDNLMYQTNYQAGLRIVDISNPEAPVEVGFFDTVPYGENNSAGVLGAWSNYPYFKSGVIVVTSGREGVFFLKKKEIDT